MNAVHSKHDASLVTHLLRRAGFGAAPDELDRAIEKGYEATVEELLNPAAPDVLPDDLIRRYHVDQSDSEYPSLDADKLVEGDLAFNLDFRSLYTEVLEDWMGVDARPVVKGEYERVGFLKW